MRRNSKGVRELITAPVTKHSEKPKEVYDRIMRLTEGENWLENAQGREFRYDHLYLELFARNYFAGWHSMGLDLPAPGQGKDIREVMKGRTLWD